eukprot:786468-Karenia_brevis.AAC.1
MYIMGYWGKCQIGHHHHRHSDLHHVVTQQSSAQKLSSSTSKVPVLDVARWRFYEVGTTVGKARLLTDKEEHVPDRAHDVQGSAGDDDEKTMMIMMMMNMM